MIDYLLTTVLLLILYLAFRFVILPKKRLRAYANALKEKGYRAMGVPFKPFGVPAFEKFTED